MNRRGFGKVALATIGSISIAGCSEVAGGSLEVSDMDSHSTTWGNVVIRAMVVNNSTDSISGTLFGEVDVRGGDTYTESRSILVRGNDSSSYKLEFDVRAGESISGAQYEYSAWVED